MSANPEKKTVSITGALSSSPSASLTKEDRKLLTLRLLETFQQSADTVALAVKNRIDAQITVADQRAIERKYSEDQPRDERGRFTSGSDSTFEPAPPPDGVFDRAQAFSTNEGYGRTEVSYQISKALATGKPLNEYQQEIVDQLKRLWAPTNWIRITSFITEER